MKFAFYWCSIIVVLTLCVFSFTNVSYAQNEEENYTSAIAITGIGLELTKQALLINNYDSAEKYSALTNNFYGKNIQFLRDFNSNFSDEMPFLMAFSPFSIKNPIKRIGCGIQSGSPSSKSKR